VFENLRREGVPIAEWLKDMGVTLADETGRMAEIVEVIGF
jgi:hypothetical protein